MKKTAVVICPGRGTYNKPELGYLARHHADQHALLSQFDAFRADAGQTTLTALDGADRFSATLHTRGDNASALIFAASYLDAQAIHDEYEVVAVTGNSMGWYSALTVGGAVSAMNGLNIVNTMGTLMQESLIGGQTLHPFVDENWVEIPSLRSKLLELVDRINARADHQLAVSIHLGGMLVVAGDDAGLRAFETAVEPSQGRYPMRLPNHAAFHTALQAPVAAKGRAKLSPDLFASPNVPLVDGRGAVWSPKSCNVDALYRYTLDHQIVQPYDFSRAIQVAAKTFAPDVFIVTGPGATLGGAIVQSLIDIKWQGVTSKESFQAQQADTPILISMGRDDQRGRATG